MLTADPDPAPEKLMPELILPTVDLHASWLEARDDWRPANSG